MNIRLFARLISHQLHCAERSPSRAAPFYFTIYNNYETYSYGRQFLNDRISHSRKLNGHFTGLLHNIICVKICGCVEYREGEISRQEERKWLSAVDRPTGDCNYS